MESVVGQQMSEDIRQARRVRREDWALGPLAPKRDVGDAQETYGAVDVRRLEGFTKRPEERIHSDTIVANDRVVIVEGRDQGRIGEVINVNKRKHECTVKGLNMVRYGDRISAPHCGRGGHLKFQDHVVANLVGGRSISKFPNGP